MRKQGPSWYLVCKSLQSQKEKEQALRSLLLSISHELRTPAQSGLAASQLLAARGSVAADDEALFLVQAIGASCRLLLGMVSNVLSMRNIESGELEMHPSAFDPRAAVHDLLQVCRLGCATSDIVWTDEDEPLPAEVTVRGVVCCCINLRGCAWPQRSVPPCCHTLCCVHAGGPNLLLPSAAEPGAQCTAAELRACLLHACHVA